jgi:hypothetical protein
MSFNEKEYQQKYREEHKEEKKFSNKQYQIEHKQDILKQKKQYYLKNQEELKEEAKQNYYKKSSTEVYKEYKYQYNKTYRKENREKLNKKQNLYRLNHPIETRIIWLISNYKKNDKKRDFVCNLTFNWVQENIINKSCIYCDDTENIGCDRIDNTKGHTKDNVVPCCYTCNIVRNDHFTFEEMKYILGPTIKHIKQLRRGGINIAETYSFNKIEKPCFYEIA